MPKFPMLFILIIGSCFGTVQSAPTDTSANNAATNIVTASEAKHLQVASEEFLKEMGSPSMFKAGAFTPNTGEIKLDNILNELHQMYVALNAGDMTTAKTHQERAQVLLKNWKELNAHLEQSLKNAGDQ